jgi:hypothetical protein
MKSYGIVILAVVLASACSSSQTTSSTNTQPANTPSSSNAATPPTAPAKTSGAPVELISCSLTDDKQNVSYKIKVNTDKPIDEVHLALKEMGAGGKVLDQTTLVWQNIVGSTRRPIESGKTYEDQSPLELGVTKVECSLKEVIFKDGTNWSAK